MCTNDLNALFLCDLTELSKGDRTACGLSLIIAHFLKSLECCSDAFSITHSLTYCVELNT